MIADYLRHEKVAETQWGRYLTEAEKTAILEAHQLFGRPSTALDVGSAGGRWSHLLSKLGWKLICIDVNAESLKQCQIRNPEAACILADPDDTTLPCEAESIGLVLCIEVFAVMPTTWFIAEASRILETNGIIVGVFNNKLSWRGYIHHVLSRFYNRFDYYKIPYYIWRRKMQQAGFRVLSETGLCWFPFSRTSESPLINACARLEYWTGLRRLPILSPWIVFVAQKTSTTEH